MQISLADPPLGAIGQVHKCESDSGNNLEGSGKHD
jgi:hypothetical protein